MRYRHCVRLRRLSQRCRIGRSGAGRYRCNWCPVPPPDLVTSVKSDLEKRLSKNLKQGMVPGVSRSLYPVVLSESERESPWGQVQMLLASAARLPREIVSDSRRTLGLVTTPEKLVAAFNVFSRSFGGALPGRAPRRCAGQPRLGADQDDPRLSNGEAETMRIRALPAH